MPRSSFPLAFRFQIFRVVYRRVISFLELHTNKVRIPVVLCSYFGHGATITKFFVSVSYRMTIESVLER